MKIDLNNRMHRRAMAEVYRRRIYSSIARQRGFIINPFAFGAAPTDPYFSSVKLLLHGGGADGSTTFTDSSTSARTVTGYGNAQIDTAYSQWGGSSILLDGTGDYLTVANHTDFAFGSGDFTLETWVRFTLNGSSGQVHGIFGKRASSAVRGPFSCYALGDGKVGFLASYNIAAGWDVNISSAASAFASDTWTHLAFVYSASRYSIFAGTSGTGNRIATFVGTGTLDTVSDAVGIGTGAANGDFPATGNMDDVRITKSVARYDPAGTTYTVPAAEFPNA